LDHPKNSRLLGELVVRRREILTGAMLTEYQKLRRKAVVLFTTNTSFCNGPQTWPTSSTHSFGFHIGTSLSRRTGRRAFSSGSITQSNATLLYALGRCSSALLSSVFSHGGWSPTPGLWSGSSTSRSTLNAFLSMRGPRPVSSSCSEMSAPSTTWRRRLSGKRTPTCSASSGGCPTLTCYPAPSWSPSSLSALAGRA
jgi:hypothetical protein